MWYLVYIVAAYVSFFVSLYGFIWCTRKVSKRIRIKRYLREDAKEYARNTKAYMDDIGHNKQALGRIIRTVTKKSKYN